MTDHFSNTPDAEQDPWLTVQQVSAELKIHPATVRVWINDGRLRAVRVGREWRVRRSEVDRALLADASPAYQQEQSSSPPRESDTGWERTPAPRQIADHIMAVAPEPERS